MKTADLTGPALDWAVAKCLGLGYRHDFKYGPMYFRTPSPDGSVAWDNYPLPYSTDWAQGGPIIEREGIALWLSNEPEKGLWAAADKRWMDLPADSEEFMNMPDPWHGPTPLIAAMRCFVASKLGDEVDVPEELK